MTHILKYEVHKKVQHPESGTFGYIYLPLTNNFFLLPESEKLPGNYKFFLSKNDFSWISCINFKPHWNKGTKYLLQWESEIRVSLDLEWSKRGRFANSLDLGWDLKSGSSTILNTNKWSKHLNSQQRLLDYEWSVFQMVGTIAIARPLKLGYLKPYL